MTFEGLCMIVVVRHGETDLNIKEDRGGPLNDAEIAQQIWIYS